MRKQFSRVVIAAGALALGLTVNLPAAGAAERYSDAICPQATAKVVEFIEMGQQAKINLVELATLTHGVIDRYDDCAKQKLADGYIEPKMHYAQTRSASFLVVAARLEAKIQDYGNAQSDLERAKALAQEVFDWTPASQVYSQSNKQSGNDSGRNSSTRPSFYHDAAKEILDALPDVQASIPKLQVQAPAGGGPAPQPTIKP